METFKDIKGFENIYQISNKGTVKSLRFNKERILRTQTDIFGYHYINLNCDGKSYKYKIHRLVAEAFIPNPNNYPIINHINEDKTDNRVENLEWCTYSYNNTYNDRAKKSGKKSGKTLSRPIIQLTKNGEFIREWESATEASKQLNIPLPNITNCINGKKYKSAGGFIWRKL